MLAAIILIWKSKGLSGLRELGARILSPGAGLYWSASIALPALCMALGYWLNPDPELYAVDRLASLFVLDLIFFGLGEEIGWRGYALPRLQGLFNALSSGLILFILWGLWHLPLFLTEQAPTQLDPSHIIGWTLSLASGSVVLTWLFNSSRGGLLGAVLFHTLYNVVSRTPGAGLMGFFVLLMGIAVILIYKPKNLAYSPRITEQANA
jgi:membrane protease YdiL (CAAX protease family)